MRFGWFFLIPAAAVMVLSCSTTPKEKDASERGYDIIGRWEGIDSTGKEGAFIFNEDGTIILEIGGNVYGGSNSNNGLNTIFTIDYSTEPFNLDIITYNPSGEVQGKMLMIIRFLTGDRIMARTFFNEVRPQNFEGSNEEDTIILNRVKRIQP